jgi:hypothetical protein
MEKTQLMQSGNRLSALLSAVLGLGASLPAQWLNYPTPGVPKTPSGLVNLGAPASRSADGHPDLSGIWEADHNVPCPPTGCWDMRAGPQFFDITSGLKDGVPLQPAAAALRQQRMAANGKDDHETKCLPSGVPRMFLHPTFRKIVQLPDLLLFLLERNASYRQVFLDGRPLPVDPQPTWNGYSVGHWEGDTMVVETNGLRDGMWLDRAGTPISDAATVVERFRRVNYGNMDIEVTVKDPKSYTRPWSTTIKQFIVLNTDLLDYICLENERDRSHFK